jgi:hypothetical protein
MVQASWYFNTIIRLAEKSSQSYWNRLLELLNPLDLDRIFDNTSNRVLDRHHPWFDRRVCVRGAIDKADHVVFRCTLDGSQADRWLKVPAWMFDRTHAMTPGF